MHNPVILCWNVYLYKIIVSSIRNNNLNKGILHVGNLTNLFCVVVVLRGQLIRP